MGTPSAGPLTRAPFAWKLAETPCLGGSESAPFLYDIGWGNTITRRQFEASGFDRLVRSRLGVGPELVRAPSAALVAQWWSDRCLHGCRWTAQRLLFRRSRLDAERLRLRVWELQHFRCFYIDRPVRPAEADVDHFVPRSR
jgi:hypothetical protein